MRTVYRLQLSKSKDRHSFLTFIRIESIQDGLWQPQTVKESGQDSQRQLKDNSRILFRYLTPDSHEPFNY